QMLRDFETKRRVPALVFVELVPVHGNRGCGHRSGEIEEDAFALPSRQRAKVAPVGGDVLKAAFVETVPGQAYVGVRQCDLLPRRIVEVRGRNARSCLAAEQPSAVQLINAPLWIRLRLRALLLRLQHARCRRAKDEHTPIDLWLVAHKSSVC